MCIYKSTSKTNLVRQNHPMDQSVDLEVVFWQTPSALFRPKFSHIKYLYTQSLFWRRVAVVWCLVLMPWQIELLVFIPAKSQLQCPIKPWNSDPCFGYPVVFIVTHSHYGSFGTLCISLTTTLCIFLNTRWDDSYPTCSNCEDMPICDHELLFTA